MIAYAMALAVALAILGGSLGIGRALLGTSGSALGTLQPAAALAVGLLVTGDVALIVGLLGLLRSWISWLVLAGLLAAGLAGFVTWIARVFVGFSPPPGKGRIALAPLAAIALLLLVCAGAPTIFYDSLLYHLGSPAGWLAGGRIEPEPGLCNSGSPMAAEALFLAAMRLAGPGPARTLAPQCLNVLLGLALLAATAAAAAGPAPPPAGHEDAKAAGRSGGSGAWTAALLLASSPTFLVVSYLPKSDTLAALFALVALAASWSAGPAPLAGALVAAAATAKATTGLIVGLPALWLLVAGGSAARAGRRALGALAGGVLVFVPWLAREVVGRLEGIPNGLATLTPAARAAVHADIGMPGSLAASLRSVAALPLEAFRGGEGSAGHPGAGWLLAGALGLLASRRDRIARVALVSGAAALATRAALSHFTRFGLVAYAALAVAGGRGLEMLLARPDRRRLRHVAIAGLALSLVAGVLDAGLLVGLRFAPQRVLLGREPPAAYLARRLPSHVAMLWANANLPARPEQRLLLVGETRRAYLRVPHAVYDAFHENPLVVALREEGSPEAAARRLRSQGFVWILRNRSEEERLFAGGLAGPAGSTPFTDRFLIERGQILYRDDRAQVYAIR